jgi:hypothetical protein
MKGEGRMARERKTVQTVQDGTEIVVCKSSTAER